MGWRGIGSGAAAAILLAWAGAAPATARTVEVTGPLSVTGSLTISWHGDPARGCAQAGLCGFSGVVDARPHGDEYDLTLSRGRLVDSFNPLDLYFNPPVVRVKRATGSDAPAACVDAPSSLEFDVTAVNAGSGRVRLGLDTPGLTSARCAGPALADLARRLPHRTRSLRQLTSRGTSADFSASVPFARGRFSGTIRSTLRVTFGRVSNTARPGGGSRTRSRRRFRAVHLHALYRVDTFSGSLAASFVGLRAPLCADVDACGVAGSATWGTDAHRGWLAIDGYARARRGDHGVRDALAALERPRSVVFGDAGLNSNRGTVTADVSRSGGSPCHDTARTTSPGIAAYNGRPGRLVFDFGSEEAGGANEDLVRAGCPGPRDEDALRLSDVALGSLPIGVLDRRAFGLDLTGSRRFTSNGYAGKWTARFRLRVHRVSAHANYYRTATLW